ncbi:hypothetical protein GCM10010302_44360 [Streptomyces polychromogenes]|uniref:Uncharacterized protein n=1 Tax=Streptomyces polychromogenes TaxID=67342 RepID=A0ABN0VH28_9ACTN
MGESDVLTVPDPGSVRLADGATARDTARRRPAGYFWTEAECRAAGEAKGLPYTCAFRPYPTPIWALYLD